MYILQLHNAHVHSYMSMCTCANVHALVYLYPYIHVPIYIRPLPRSLPCWFAGAGPALDLARAPNSARASDTKSRRLEVTQALKNLVHGALHRSQFRRCAASVPHEAKHLVARGSPRSSGYGIPRPWPRSFWPGELAVGTQDGRDAEDVSPPTCRRRDRHADQPKTGCAALVGLGAVPRRSVLSRPPAAANTIALRHFRAPRTKAARPTGRANILA